MVLATLQAINILPLGMEILIPQVDVTLILEMDLETCHQGHFLQ
jgi:hypothetical protein